MTGKMRLVLLLVLFIAVHSSAQKPAKDVNIDSSFTALDYEELFNELDLLLDSLTEPRSFGLFNIAAGYNYYSSESKESLLIQTRKRLTYLPSLSYFFKNGLGISGSSIIVNDGQKVNPYQFNVTGSYDYIKNNKFFTGISLTHFFTKDSLPFYTSPLKKCVVFLFHLPGVLVKTVGGYELWMGKQERLRGEGGIYYVTSANREWFHEG